MDFAAGDRSADTFSRLYDLPPAAEMYCSDRYAVYRWFPQYRHCVGKGGSANRNAGLYAALWSWLNRLMRRTKGYTNIARLLVYSLAPVCGRQGENLISAYIKNTGMALKDDHWDGRFAIPGTPEVDRGINVAVGVTFDAGAPDIRAMQMEIIGVGVDFER